MFYALSYRRDVWEDDGYYEVYDVVRIGPEQVNSSTFVLDTLPEPQQGKIMTLTSVTGETMPLHCITGREYRELTKEEFKSYVKPS